MLRAISFVLLALPLAFSTFCPEGSVEYGDNYECILAVDADATYDSAQKTCQALGGHLIQLRDAFENAFANSQKTQVLGGHEAFIGVKRTDGVWRYADGSNLTYAKWVDAPPWQIGDDCGIIRSTDAYWDARPCVTRLPFICSFSDHACPEGWHRYAETGDCYYTPMGIAWTTWRNITFDLGEYICSLLYRANLVSIHSEHENQFVQNLTAIAMASFPHDCSYYETVIGLNVTTWTDGSPFDYDLRVLNTSSTFALRDPACGNPYWEGAPYNADHSSFMCKKMLQLGTIALLLIAAAQARFCPDGSLEFSDGNECIFAVDADTTYDSAQRTCRAFGGHLVQPKTDLENAFVGSQKTQVLKNRDVYIGVRRQDGTWKYGDGSMMNFTKWPANPPTQAGYDCGIMQASSNYWTSSPCTTKRPFICTFSDHPCPDGWAFNEDNDYCYYTPMGLYWPAIWYRNNVTFDLGEQACVNQYNAHLVSIHSAKENQFVKDLVSKSIADYQYDCSGNRWLIGLRSTNWTDGSAFDYDNRGGASSTWGIYDPACGYSSWLGGNLEQLYQSYICKKSASAFRVNLPKKLAAVHEAAKISRLTNTPFSFPSIAMKH